MRQSLYAILIATCGIVTLEVRVASAADLPNVSLRNARTDVMSVYSDLSRRTMAERRVIFRTLSPAMQSDLWAVHLEQFVASHPELSVEQRSVVFEGLGILAAGVFDSSDKDGQIHTALRYLESRAKTTISKELLSEAFSTLGGPDLGSVGAGDGAVAVPLFASRQRPIRSLYDPPACDCSTTSDWCPGECIFLREMCTFTIGCGFLWQDGCNGLCF